MGKTRRMMIPEFKTTVTLEAIRRVTTVNEIAAKNKVHPNKPSKWKKRTRDNRATLFTDGPQVEKTRKLLFLHNRATLFTDGPQGAAAFVFDGYWTERHCSVGCVEIHELLHDLHPTDEQYAQASAQTESDQMATESWREEIIN